MASAGQDGVKLFEYEMKKVSLVSVSLLFIHKNCAGGLSDTEHIRENNRRAGETFIINRKIEQ